MRSTKLLGIDAVLDEHVVERGPADVEHPGRPADVAAAPHEGIDDEPPLALVARLPKGGERVDDGGGIQVEVRGPDDPAGRHDDGSVDLVLELADVARPLVLDDGLQGLGAEANLALEGLAIAAQEGIGEEDHVLTALAERRQVDGDHGESIVEILAEAAAAQGFVEALVGGRHHAHVDGDDLATAHPLDLALLQEAQQLHLEGQAHLRDLVQEEGSAGGHLDLALALGVGPRERAPLVAEELTLEQRLGDRPAVDGHERPAAPRAMRVNGPGHQLLARAALPLAEHGGIRLGHALDDPEDLAHLGRGAENIREADGVLLLLGLLLALPLELAQVGGAAEHHLEVVEIDRLQVVVEGPALHGGHGIGAIAIARDDDDLGIRGGGEDVLERAEPLLGRVGSGGKPQIRRHDLRRRLLDGGGGPCAISRHGHVVLVLQGVRQLGADVLVVLDDQQAFAFHRSVPPLQCDDGRAEAASWSPPATRSSSRSRSRLQLWFDSTHARPAAAKRSRAAGSRSRVTTSRLNSRASAATSRSCPATALMPSKAAGLATTGTRMAMASSTLFCRPRATRRGATATAAESK